MLLIWTSRIRHHQAPMLQHEPVVWILDHGHVIGGAGYVDVHVEGDSSVKSVSSLDVSLDFKGKVFVWVFSSGHENRMRTNYIESQ